MDISHGLVFGVTGHRSLENMKELEILLIHELDRLASIRDLKTIISPLAEGADRLVVKIMLDHYAVKLNVLLPFEVEEYNKDFSNEGKKDFSLLLSQAESIKEVSSLEKYTRNECYLQVGEEVVDRCDILIALWNGKVARSMGGTADIVAYAQKCGKGIIYLNTETYQVELVQMDKLSFCNINSNNPNDDR